jgi:Flp pilus assembly protein TadG
MRKAARRFLLDRGASVAVEFAIAAPVMLLIAGGVFTLGSLLRVNSALNRLAMQYAISFADCSDTSSGVCQTELNEYVTSSALAAVAPQLLPGNLTLSMAQVKMNGSTPAVEYYYPSGFSLSAAQTSALQAVVVSGQTGVVVTATYRYQVLQFSAVMAPVLSSSYTLSYTVAQLK